MGTSKAVKLSALVAVLMAAAALGGFQAAQGGGSKPPATCVTKVLGSGYSSQTTYVCTVTKMPGLRQTAFELRLPAIDLRCDALGADLADNIPPGLSCDRLSVPEVPIRCRDGVLGSMTVFMSLRHVETESSQTCVTRARAPYYKVTRGIESHVFVRNP
ncbi:MAG TPA: hypothetical protein VFU51_01790 [Gaiellaceae bacterium]|nr:hypothetical protein [Gaiellaceae bacterium]